MTKLKTLCFAFSIVALIVLAACASPAAPLSSNAAQPTADAAMMKKETDTAMMAKETDSAMMAKETDTAMMAKETDTAMMAKETDTAMMAKETDSAMMAKETDTAMMMAHETETAVAKPTEAAMMVKFPAQQFAAHFVDSMPMHEATLTKLPEQIVLNFNFTLSDTSTITIEKNGKEIKSAAGKLGDKKLSMTTEIPADAGAGLYLVKYKACWPDNSCHNGQFAFLIK